MKQEYRFSEKGVIEKQIAKHREYKIESADGQYICLVVGDTNTAKTSLSILLEHYIAEGDVNLDTVALTHDKFMEEYTSKPKRKIIIYEEGRFSFDINKYNAKETAEARDKINQYRKFHHTLFINFQNPNHLTPEIVRNADALVRLPSKGIIHYYSKPKIESMWDSRNNFRGWEDYDARDFAPDPAEFIPETWKAYEDQVESELEERGSKESSDEGEQEDEDELGIEKQFKVSTVAERLDLHPGTLRRKCRNDKIENNKVQGEFRIPESQVKEMVE